MKTITGIHLVVPLLIPQEKLSVEMNSNSWLAVGAIIALLLFIYLIVVLIKPEKF